MEKTFHLVQVWGDGGERLSAKEFKENTAAWHHAECALFSGKRVTVQSARVSDELAEAIFGPRRWLPGSK